MTEKGGNLPSIKKKNISLIKETIYRYGPISRVEVAKHLSLTNPTITTNVTAMLQEGLIVETDAVQEEKALGRRPVLLDFNAGARYVVGVELGPYKTHIVVCNLRGMILCQHTEQFAEGSYQKMTENLTTSLERAIQDSGVKREKIAGIGIALPGFVDAQAGTVHNNLRQDWVARQIRRDMERKVAYPVCIENNVRARMIGVDLFGKKAEGDPVLYYFVSRGLACSMMVHHQILAGKASAAGEIGHMVVEPDGPRCETCGNRGCLEAVASEQTILKRCQSLLDQGKSQLLQETCREAGGLNMDAVLKAQSGGDSAVDSILRQVLRYIGLNIANLMNFVSPETVLIDGRIFSVKQNREILRAIVDQNVFGGAHKEYRLQFVKYDRLGGARGAAAVAVKRFVLEK